MSRVAQNRSTPRRKRILLVDDHPLMREGVARWIQGAPGLEFCGEADSASAAIALIEKLKPDLVITDISLPGRSGIELIKDLLARKPSLPVLVLSMHDESLYAARALRAGARGYVMKSAGGTRVVAAIGEVLKGQIAVNQQIATNLLEQYSKRRPSTSRSPLPHLTDREFEIFQLLGEARTNREIAHQLNLSPKTVETHRMNLLRKLDLKTSAQLLRFAIQYVEQEATGRWEG